MRRSAVRSIAGLLYGLAQVAVSPAVHAQNSRIAAVQAPTGSGITGQAGAALSSVGGPMNALSPSLGSLSLGPSLPCPSSVSPAVGRGKAAAAIPALPAAAGAPAAAAVPRGAAFAQGARADAVVSVGWAAVRAAVPRGRLVDEAADARAPAAPEGGAADVRSERYRRELIRSVRRQARALVSGMRKGRGSDELDRLERTAFSEPEPDAYAPPARIEAARVLLRLVADPGLIVQSRGFVKAVGLEDTVALDATVRSIHQGKRLSPARKALRRALESETPAELDAALPPVSRLSRRLLLEPAKPRYRELPSGSGMSLRKDDDPRLRAEVARRGVGARDFNLPELARVRPPEEFSDSEAAAVRGTLDSVDRLRLPGPRALSWDESEAIIDGRTAPSRTLGRGGRGSRARRRYRLAAGLVNRWIRAGEDLDLDKLQALSRIILDESKDYREAGRLRDYDNGLWLPGEFVSFAPWEVIPAYLEDLMVWYDANKGSLHPVVLAALAYQQFVRIHPFPNGNGRVGRLVMDFILQRNGYLPPVFDEVDERTILERPASVVQSVGRGILRSAELLGQRDAALAADGLASR